MDSLFGKGKFNSFNAYVKAFQVFDHTSLGANSPVLGFTRGYKPSDWTLRALDDFLKSRVLTDLVGLDGARLRKPQQQNVIPSRDADGKKAKRWITIRHFVPVNQESIRGALERLDARAIEASTLGRAPSDLQRIKTQLRLVQRLARNGVVPGSMPQRYIEVESGRIYGQEFHLQNVKRDLKEIALSNAWEYDCKNCQFAIFAQLARRSGYEPRTIPTYLDSKEETRKALAEKVDVSVDKIKELLLAILYGAGRPTPVYPQATVIQMFEGDRERAQQLYHDDIVRGLVEDREEGARVIIENLPMTRNPPGSGPKYGNPHGKFTSAERKPGERRSKRVSRILAHVLQGAEARALNIACEPLSDELLLQQHDGFTVDRRIDKHRAERAIAETELGLELELEEKKLKPRF